MATDFDKPVVTDAYATLLPGLVQAHKDLARMLEPTLTGAHTNVPVGTVQWNATNSRWERYNGSSWVTLPSAGNNVYAISISGNAAGLTSTGSNWIDTPAKDNVVGMLSWRNYGSGHVIFDASKGLSPPGTTVSDTDPSIRWGPTYPTLMGWNGIYTYGVRVDSARVSDMTTKLATARTIGGVSFDGTANINLPGVNTTGNQNTTGNAASASSLNPLNNYSVNTLTANVVNASTSIYGTTVNFTYSTVVSGGYSEFLSTGYSSAKYGKYNDYLYWSAGGVDRMYLKDDGSGLTLLSGNFTGGGTGLTGTASALNAGVGAGQTWQDMTSSRSLGSTVTNSTGKAIHVFVTTNYSGAGTQGAFVNVNGITIGTLGYSASGNKAIASFIVPNGSNYSIGTAANVSLVSWFELR